MKTKTYTYATSEMFRYVKEARLDSYSDKITRLGMIYWDKETGKIEDISISRTSSLSNLLERLKKEIEKGYISNPTGFYQRLEKFYFDDFTKNKTILALYLTRYAPQKNRFIYRNKKIRFKKLLKLQDEKKYDNECIKDDNFSSKGFLLEPCEASRNVGKKLLSRLSD